MMRTLIIAPHPDDESISCGGLIQVRGSASIRVDVMHGRAYDYGKQKQEWDEAEERDFQSAREILGFRHHHLWSNREGEPQTVGYYRLLEGIETVLRHWKPTEVVIPAGDDLNQDHRHLNHVCKIALRPYNLGGVKRVLEFFALDGVLRQPNYFVPLTREQLERKLQAVAAYRREARTTGPRAPESIIAQARVWGSLCGSEFAEGYRLHLGVEECALLLPGDRVSLA